MKPKTPVLIVNFKTYEESTGKNALKLAKICNKVSKDTKKSIAISVQSLDLKEIAKNVKISVLAQHIDGEEFGAKTGHILPNAVILSGGVGALLNHSEDQYDFEDLKKASEKMKELGMVRIICANTPQKAKEVATLKPEFIAIEPPELIGGTVSVSKAKPEIITNTINIVKQVSPSTQILCGAGVNSSEDVKIALKLGAKGILLASAIVKAKDPEKILKEMVLEF